MTASCVAITAARLASSASSQPKNVSGASATPSRDSNSIYDDLPHARTSGWSRCHVDPSNHRNSSPSGDYCGRHGAAPASASARRRRPCATALRPCGRRVRLARQPWPRRRRARGADGRRDRARPLHGLGGPRAHAAVDARDARAELLDDEGRRLDGRAPARGARGARLRRADRHVLAGVRRRRQGAGDRARSAHPPGRAVERARRRRAPRGPARPPRDGGAAGGPLGAGADGALGLPRDHLRLARGRPGPPRDRRPRARGARAHGGRGAARRRAGCTSASTRPSASSSPSRSGPRCATSAPRRGSSRRRSPAWASPGPSTTR